jgi:hypothetical protein
MTKNAFDWQGEPSIWSRDKQLKKILQGQNWGRQTQAKINPNEKREIFYYSKAKLKNDS